MTAPLQATVVGMSTSNVRRQYQTKVDRSEGLRLGLPPGRHANRPQSLVDPSVQSQRGQGQGEGEKVGPLCLLPSLPWQAGP